MGVQGQLPKSQARVDDSVSILFVAEAPVETEWNSATVVHAPVERGKKTRSAQPSQRMGKCPALSFWLLYHHTLELASAEAAADICPGKTTGASFGGILEEIMFLLLLTITKFFLIVLLFLPGGGGVCR